MRGSSAARRSAPERSSRSLTARSLSFIETQTWDLLIIGGGITGAGILREAAQQGLRALLVEQNDFASGTSSRSSKLVHGGFHYLGRLQFGLVRDAVRERERLLRDSNGLVDSIEFLVPIFAGERIPHWVFMTALCTYQAFAGRVAIPRLLPPIEARRRVPDLSDALIRAYSFGDARVDDARLVLSVLRDAQRSGGRALNYLAATEFLRNARGEVIGAALEDRISGETVEVNARAVVNATGPWADRLRQKLGAPSRLRLIAGSHILFDGSRLPVSDAIAARHPDSNRSMHVVPWEGVTIVGTTHVERDGPEGQDPGITLEEFEYLISGVQHLFPNLGITEHDVLSTFTGVRPIVDRQSGDPGNASRDLAIWDDDGLLTVAGGKMTTFRLTALRVLKRLRYRVKPSLKSRRVDGRGSWPSDFNSDELPFDPCWARRLLSRYGPEGLYAIAAMPCDDREALAGQCVLWGELRWAAREEHVHHLDDLLLRRVRIGVTTPHGGLLWSDRIRDVVKPELGWDDARWNREVDDYRKIWRRSHGPPGRSRLVDTPGHAKVGPRHSPSLGRDAFME
jgi:glycerol-3-phosphate dehydrogenase